MFSGLIYASNEDTLSLVKLFLNCAKLVSYFPVLTDQFMVQATAGVHGFLTNKGSELAKHVEVSGRLLHNPPETRGLERMICFAAMSK